MSGPHAALPDLHALRHSAGGFQAPAHVLLGSPRPGGSSSAPLPPCVGLNRARHTKHHHHTHTTPCLSGTSSLHVHVVLTYIDIYTDIEARPFIVVPPLLLRPELGNLPSPAPSRHKQPINNAFHTSSNLITPTRLPFSMILLFFLGYFFFFMRGACSFYWRGLLVLNNLQ